VNLFSLNFVGNDSKSGSQFAPNNASTWQQAESRRVTGVYNEAGLHGVVLVHRKSNVGTDTFGRGRHGERDTRPACLNPRSPLVFNQYHSPKIRKSDDKIWYGVTAWDIYLGMWPATQVNSAWPSLRGEAQWVPAKGRWCRSAGDQRIKEQRSKVKVTKPCKSWTWNELWLNDSSWLRIVTWKLG